MRFWIDVETPAGIKVGDGPIATATNWRHIARLDRAGEIAFTMSARDPRAALVVDHPKRIARCRGQLYPGAAIIDLGAGLVEAWSVKPDKNGDAQLTVTGGDLLRELTHRSVGFLALDDGSGGPITTALASIIAKAPTWSLDATGYTTTGRSDYGSFAGELVLDALGKLAAHAGQHFRQADAALGRKVRWLRAALVTSGMRAVQGGEGIALEDNHDVCLIENIEEQSDGFDLLTRVYPFGAGNGESRLTLAKTSRSAPAGYTLNKTTNELVNTAAETALGVRIERYLSWKEISPISNSDTDLQSAADVLFDAALRELQIRGQVQKAYNLRVAKCDQVLYPGMTLRVIYQGWVQLVDYTGAATGNYHYLNIDANLYILETTTEINSEGLRTVGLTVATVDAWPTSEAELIADEMAAGRLMDAHPQLTIAYSPVGPYTRRVDATHTAVFVARIGVEVTALNYAILRFKTSPLVSSVKSVGSTVSGSVALPSHTHNVPNHAHSVPDHAHNTTVSDASEVYPASISVAGSNAFLNGVGMGADKLLWTNSSGGTTSATDGQTTSGGGGNGTFTIDLSGAITATYGIYQDTLYPTTISIAIDGTDRTIALGGPWAGGGAAVTAELDITTYLANASGGLRQNHTITFSCTSGQGEIEAEIDMLVSIQAIAVV